MTASNATLRKLFGLDAFRPWQQEAINALLGGGSGLVVAPTGGGKSLCYQYPAVVLAGTSVVVSPLIALMDDQVRGLNARGIRATYLSSTLDRDEVRRREHGLRRGHYQLVYVAPERLRSDWLLRLLGSLNMPLLAVDEAHCISQWGHDFRPDYLRLGDVVRALRPPRLLACTATATPAVRREIRQRLHIDDDHAGSFEVLRGFSRPNLHLCAWEIDGAALRNTATLRRVREVLGPPNEPRGAAIVYAGTRRGCEKLAAQFQAAGWRARPYHAGLPADQRERVSEVFAKQQLDVVIATNAFGMGIDRPDIRVVVHTRAPGSIEQYYQEVGRAGRDGQPAHGLLLSGSSDFGLRRRLIDMSCHEGDAQAAAYADRQWKMFLDLMRYVEAGSCRHDFILRYFGDERETLGGCGHCDVCERLVDGHTDGYDDEARTLIVRKALSGVARLRGRAGLSALADSLHGSKARRMQQLGLDTLSTHGLLAAHSRAWILALLRRLLTAGWVEVTRGDFPVPFLTASGRAVMKGEALASVVLPPAGVGKATKKRAARAGRRPAQVLDGPEEMALFETLRAARLVLAKGRGVPAYVVCHDRTLADMAHKKPADLHQMRDVFGMGPARIDAYGEAFLRALGTGE